MTANVTTDWLDLAGQSLDDTDQQILADLEPLLQRAEDLWESQINTDPYRRFVAADYAAVFGALVHLRPRAETFLEWGSGLGVITMMASCLGYRACGIEVESELVEQSRDLADEFAPDARFALGNFIPADYDWQPEFGDDGFFNDSYAEPGYAELGMDLDEFDLIYAFPWPDEQILCQHMMAQCGNPDGLYLYYDAREGLALSKFTNRSRPSRR